MSRTAVVGRMSAVREAHREDLAPIALQTPSILPSMAPLAAGTPSLWAPPSPADDPAFAWLRTLPLPDRCRALAVVGGAWVPTVRGVHDHGVACFLVSLADVAGFVEASKPAKVPPVAWLGPCGLGEAPVMASTGMKALPGDEPDALFAALRTCSATTADDTLCLAWEVVADVDRLQTTLMACAANVLRVDVAKAQSPGAKAAYVVATAGGLASRAFLHRLRSVFAAGEAMVMRCASFDACRFEDGARAAWGALSDADRTAALATAAEGILPLPPSVASAAAGKLASSECLWGDLLLAPLSAKPAVTAWRVKVWQALVGGDHDSSEEEKAPPPKLKPKKRRHRGRRRSTASGKSGEEMKEAAAGAVPVVPPRPASPPRPPPRHSFIRGILLRAADSAVTKSLRRERHMAPAMVATRAAKKRRRLHQHMTSLVFAVADAVVDKMEAFRGALLASSVDGLPLNVPISAMLTAAVNTGCLPPRAMPLAVSARRLHGLAWAQLRHPSPNPAFLATCGRLVGRLTLAAGRPPPNLRSWFAVGCHPLKRHPVVLYAASMLECGLGSPLHVAGSVWLATTLDAVVRLARGLPAGPTTELVQGVASSVGVQSAQPPQGAALLFQKTHIPAGLPDCVSGFKLHKPLRTPTVDAHCEAKSAEPDSPVASPLDLLHLDILDMSQSLVNMARSGALARDAVVDRFRAVINREFPGARVEVYGSAAPALAPPLSLPGSDIDLVVCDVMASYEDFFAAKGEGGRGLVARLSAVLQKQPWVQRVQAVTSAPMPVVKTFATTTGLPGVSVDVSFDSPRHRGLATSLVVSALQREHPAMTPVVLLLKQFLIQQGLKDPFHGGLSSYALVIMVVASLQGSTEAHLGAILLRFLTAFGAFDAARAAVSVSTSDGGFIDRPAAFVGDPLVVLDPLDPTNNVARGCWGVAAVLNAFAAAGERLQAAIAAFSSVPHLPDARRLLVRLGDGVEGAPPPALTQPGVLGALFYTADHRNVVELVSCVWRAEDVEGDGVAPARRPVVSADVDAGRSRERLAAWAADAVGVLARVAATACDGRCGKTCVGCVAATLAATYKTL